MFNLAMMMARKRQEQWMFPNSDVSTTGWTPTPLWSNLNVLNQDSDFVSSALAGGRKAFTVGMQTPLDPGTDAGWGIDVSMRWSPSVGDPPVAGHNTLISLLQVTTLIQQFSFASSTLTNSFQVYTFNLSALNVVNITSFPSLRITVDYDPGGTGLNNQADVSWIRLRVPGI